MDQLAGPDAPLIGPDDPPPVAIVNPGGAAAVLLLCDHAANAIPRALGGLGLTERDLHRHIAWDIGAAALTRALAARLDAPAVLAGYSRLVIDCNRPLDHPTSIVAESDGVAIPGNRDLDAAAARRRADEVFWPYHRKIGAGIAGFALRGIRPVILSIHSFTPVLGGVRRPWDVGVLWDRDGRVARPLIAALAVRGDLVVGDNQPYSGRMRYGYSIEVHATETGLANALIEVREDRLADADGQARMADVLAAALSPVLADPGLGRRMDAAAEDDADDL